MRLGRFPAKANRPNTISASKCRQRTVQGLSHEFQAAKRFDFRPVGEQSVVIGEPSQTSL